MSNWESFDRPMRHRRPLRASVSLLQAGVITLNRPAYTMLGHPMALILLYDPGRKWIGLRPAEVSEPNAYKVVALRGGGGSIQYASFARRYGISLDYTRRYPVELSDGVLIIDLTKEERHGPWMPTPRPYAKEGDQ